MNHIRLSRKSIRRHRVERLETRRLLSGNPLAASLLKDVVTIPNSSNPANLAAVGATTFFTADDGKGDAELWKTDGTAGGTTLVKDLGPSNDNRLSNFTNVDGTLCFVVSANLVSGPVDLQVWKSDGTAAGTTLVQDLGGVSSLTLADFGAKLVVSVESDTGGNLDNKVMAGPITPNGLTVIQDSGQNKLPPSDFAVVNGELYFAANNVLSAATGSAVTDELWKSDGTAIGTQMVAAITFTLGSGGFALERITELTAVNSSLFFSAYDGSTGQELWTSDGTTAGTKEVLDIFPGTSSGSPNSSEPSDLTNVNGALYFTATDATHGLQLWTSDGTAAGTKMLSDVTGGVFADIANLGANVIFSGLTGGLFKFNSASGVSQISTTPQELFDPVVSGGTLYFLDESGSGMPPVLWKTQGDSGDTSTVADASNSMRLDFQVSLSPFAGGVLFSATDSVHGKELWKSDGTVPGTALVKDIVPTDLGSYPQGAVVVGGLAYFFSNPTRNGLDLWRTDGTSAGTIPFPVASGLSSNDVITGPPLIQNVNGRLYFAASGQVWTSDGTAAGTLALAKIDPNYEVDEGVQFVGLNGVVLFVTYVDNNGGALWRTDGTAAGTFALANTSSTFEAVNNLITLGGEAYFAGVNPQNQSMTLWKSDGTITGTQQVGTQQFGAQDFSPADFVTLGGKLYFTGTSTVNASTGQVDSQLWTSDGTAAGTTMVFDFGTAHSPVASLNVAGGKLYLVDAPKNVSSTEFETWVSDGTAAGTSLLNTFSSTNRFAVQPGNFTPLNGKVVFTADDGTHGIEPWVTDDTAAGTQLLADINPGSGGSSPGNFTNFNGRLLFSANNGTSTQLWSTDGTPVGTVLVANVNPGTLANFVSFNGDLYFTGDDGTHGSQLWKTDGTAAGTSMVTDINPVEGNAGFAANYLTNLNGTLVFSGNDGTHGLALWMSDGTAAGTAMIAGSAAMGQIGPISGGFGLSPTEFTPLGSSLLLASDDGTHGLEPWVVSTSQGVASTGGFTLTATEGASSGSQTLATFTDPNGAQPLANYSSSISWGDGTSTTAGTISGPDANGLFTVTAAHTYAEETANGTIAVTISDASNGATASVDATAQVADAALTATTASVAATEGASFSGKLATFTDANPAATAGDYTVTVNWGDQTSATSGSVTLSGGMFTVTGTHTYAEEASNLPVVVTISDHGASASVTGTANVSDAALTATAIAVSATEGAGFSGRVATFTDANPAGAAGDYTVTINWGDQTSASAGAVTLSGGVFTVTGSHTYAEEASNLQVTVTISDHGATTSVTGTANVSDAALTATAVAVAATEGASFSGRVATFTDADPAAAASDYTVTIDWGDQTSATSGVVSLSGGVFTVTGSQTYAEEASNLPVSVTISDHGATTSVNGTANVADASLSATAATVFAAVNSTFTGQVATFSDADPAGAAGDYTAEILWGDGSSSTGAVTPAAGGFAVSGSHLYTQTAAGLPLSVRVFDGGGASATAQGSATVSQLLPAVQVTGTSSLTATESLATHPTLATFTDPNGALALSAYSATIDWGDGGGTTSGTISGPDATGVFTVVGSHDYAEENLQGNHVTVTVHRTGALDALPVTDTVVVEDAPLSATALPLHGQPGNTLSNVAVATFSDADPAGTVGDYTATIDWGDGTTSTGTVAAQGAGFVVTASHAFAALGNPLVKVAIADTGGASASVAASALIGTANQVAVDSVYEDLLGRAADPGGLALFVSELTANTPLATVVSQIDHSDEFYRDLVTDDFRKFLDRAPDAAGLAAWVSVLKAGLTIEELEASIISSPEFFANAGSTDALWLGAVYEALLGRPGDASGLQFWSGQLTAGVTRFGVALAIATSPEQLTAQVSDFYFRYLDRAADPAGLTDWVEQLDHGESEQDVIASIVGSTEFYKLHTS